MTEKDELFGGINLMSQPSEIFIDVPGEEQSVEKEEQVEKDVKSKKPTSGKEIDIEDEYEGLIEIPDAEVDDNGEEPSSPPEEKDSSSPSPIEPFAKALFEEGILPNFDEELFKKRAEELGDIEALFETIRDTITAEIEAFKVESDEDYQKFLQAKEEGVDLNEYASISTNKKRFSSITEDSLDEDDKLQKALVTEYLKLKGFDSAEIADTVESYEDTAKLYNKAKLALKNLKTYEDNREKELFENTKKQREENTKALAQQRSELKSVIDSTEFIMPEVKLTGIEKKKLYEMITVPIEKDQYGNQINAVMKKRMENPLQYAILEAYYNNLGFFDKKFDKIVKKAKSSSVKEFANAVQTGAAIRKPSSKPAISESLSPDYDEAWGRV